MQVIVIQACAATLNFMGLYFIDRQEQLPEDFDNHNGYM